MPNGNSIVEYFGPQTERQCGYCKSGDQKTRFTHGMWAHSMSVQVYQDLLDRGWRRSGHYCYKPTMDKTCCPQYTIRSNALEFRPSRSQKRAVRRLNAYLASGIMPKRSAYDVDVDRPKKDDESIAAKEESGRANESKKPIGESAGNNGSKSTTNDGDRRQRKAKYRRQQRKLEKLRAKGIAIDSFPPRPPPDPKPVEDFLSFSSSSSTKCLKIDGAKHTLEIRLVRSAPENDEFKKTFSESAAVYIKYQEAIHHDPSTEDGFRRFLVDSPLESIEDESNSNDDFPGYGSFHQQYWLDGTKLIAVGVLDILPSSISSKYFFYDPEYRPLALGVYSAVQEEALVRRLHRHAPQLRYYYMGFYIHTCPKMRYKGRYRPSELLCPEAFSWHPIELCQTKLDQASYCRFDETGADDPDAEVDLGQMSILCTRTVIPYQMYRKLKYKGSTRTDEAEVAEYARLVGNKAAPSMILFRSIKD